MTERTPEPLTERPPCSWCTRKRGHRSNCPRPDERYTAFDLAEARKQAAERVAALPSAM